MEQKCGLQCPSPCITVFRGDGVELRENSLTTGAPGEGVDPSPDSCLTEGLFKVPWDEKTSKCGHVIYL